MGWLRGLGLSLSLCLCLAGGGAAAAWAPFNAEATGAARGPAALPAGASSLYAEVGYPEVGAGFRQGLGRFELEVRGRFDYRQTRVSAEGLFKLAVLRGPRWSFAPLLGIGVAANAGATYADEHNFGYVALRLVAGGIVSYAVSPDVQAFGTLDVPVDAVTSRPGSYDVAPRLGAGVEWQSNSPWSLFVHVEAGPAFRQNDTAYRDTRLSVAARVGVGYRLF